MVMRVVFCWVFVGLMGVVSVYADDGRADDGRFAIWIKNVQSEARQKGISDKYLAALESFSPDPEILRLAGRQLEFVKPVWAYIEAVVTEKRLQRGREQLQQNAAFLRKLEDKYGVPREIIIAIWGIETNYGRNMGHFPVLQALATLGYEGKRADFGRKQLFAALEILQLGEIGLADFKGSWAGAMGHTQFIPTTYLGYAVDGTDDGVRNIWTEPYDALASTAHYLHKSKWQPHITWGVEVNVGDGFEFADGGLKKYRPAAYWQKRGVVAMSGVDYSDWGDMAFYAPAGVRGPMFLLTRNFASLLRYNHAPSYALSVAHLADRMVRPQTHFVRAWPMHDRPLRHQEIETLQQKLQSAGYDTGGVDGILGALTRKAVFQFQHDNGLIADGYATPALLTILENTKNLSP